MMTTDAESFFSTFLIRDDRWHIQGKAGIPSG
jgi:hypothetical protein